MLDDLERALEAAEQHEEAKLEDGVRLVHRALVGRAARRRGSTEIETDGAFDPHVHEALLAQPSEAETGTVIQVLQKGYRLGDRVLRPAAGDDRRSDVALRDRSASRRTRRRTRSRRRTASSRASTTRTRTRATRRPRRASRRSSRAYDVLSDPEKRKQYDAFGGERRARRPAGRRRSTSTSATSGPRRLFGGLFGGGGRGRQQRSSSAASAAPTSRSHVHLSFEDSLKGVAGRRCRSSSSSPAHTCHGTGAKPGTAPKHLPGVQRPRRRRRARRASSRSSSRARAAAATARSIETPCPTCKRHRPRAAHEALHGARSRPASRTARGSG